MIRMFGISRRSRNISNTQIYNVSGLIIKFKGRSETKWTKSKCRTDCGGSSTTLKYHGNEEYFQHEIYLLGSKNDERIEIPAGTVSYPFSYTLPSILPSSFEGDHGFIRYTIKATLDRPWKFNQDTKMAFTVISQMDLNNFPEARSPLKIEMRERFCCWACQSGELAVDVGLPRSGYCSGETLPIEIITENGSNVSLNAIAIELMKIVSFHSQLPRAKTKTSEISIGKVNTDKIPSNSTKTFKRELEIPPLPPSNLENCTIINLDYKLKIICVAPGCRRNLEKTSPILIGTIPLGCIQQVDQRVDLPNAVVSENPLLVSSFLRTQDVPHEPITTVLLNPNNSLRSSFANRYSPTNRYYPDQKKSPTTSYPTKSDKNPSESLPPSYETCIGPNLPNPAISTSPYSANLPLAGDSPYNSQMSDAKPPANSNPSAPLMEDTDLPPTIPLLPYLSAQPIYRQSQFTATSIHDDSDNPHTRISGNSNFAPRYPTYGLLSNQHTSNLNMN